MAHVWGQTCPIRKSALSYLLTSLSRQAPSQRKMELMVADGIPSPPISFLEAKAKKNLLVAGQRHRQMVVSSIASANPQTTCANKGDAEMAEVVVFHETYGPSSSCSCICNDRPVVTRLKSFPTNRNTTCKYNLIVSISQSHNEELVAEMPQV
jgi:hypothetical protein